MHVVSNEVLATQGPDQGFTRLMKEISVFLQKDFALGECCVEGVKKCLIDAYCSLGQAQTGDSMKRIRFQYDLLREGIHYGLSAGDFIAAANQQRDNHD
ncbi:MAG: hypothetical protein U0487_01675 [Patescibacteria group bacterium]